MIPALILATLGAGWVAPVAASCEPPVAFLPPTYTSDSLAPALANISTFLDEHLSHPRTAAASVAIEITSSQQQLGGYYHSSDPFTTVNSSSVFRGASHSKIFTSLAILRLHAEGKIASLDDPIVQYVDGLQLEREEGSVDWDRISIRDLLTHLSGILDKYAQSDLLADLDAATRSAIGLPPVGDDILNTLPQCELNYSIPCDAEGLLSKLQSAEPVLPPHWEASNSNAGYSLLGLLITNITGVKYEAYIQETIIRPLGLKSTTFTAPPTGGAPIVGRRSLWDWDMAVNNPSSGVYTSTHDLSLLHQWILGNYNKVHPRINWLAPAFFAAGSHSYIGMPWEIFRTNALLPHTNRPVTMHTIEGWLGTYFSYTVLIADYDLAIVMLVSGQIGNLHDVIHQVTSTILDAADKIAHQDLQTSYAGTYIAEADDGATTRVTLGQSPARSLHLQNFIVNGTSILETTVTFVSRMTGLGSDWYFQLVPTSIVRHRKADDSRASQIGEVWRIYNNLDVPAEHGWNDYCVSSFDAFSFAGLPMNEVVFWRGGEAGDIVELEMTSRGLKLHRQGSSSGMTSEHWQIGKSGIRQEVL